MKQSEVQYSTGYKAVVIFCVTLNFLTVGFLGYGWFKTTQELNGQADIISTLVDRIEGLEKVKLFITIDRVRLQCTLVYSIDWDSVQQLEVIYSGWV